MSIAFIILLLAVLVAPISNLSAQMSNPAPQQQNQPTLETPEDVQTKIELLRKQPIIEKDALLLRDLERVDSEIANASVARNFANQWKNSKTFHEQMVARVNKQAKMLGSFDCDRNINKYIDVANAYQIEYGKLYNAALPFGVESSLEGARLPFGAPNAPLSDICKTTQEKFASSDLIEGLREATDLLIKSISDYVVNQEKLAAAYETYVTELRSRRSTLQDKLSTSQPAFQIGTNLPLLLGILAIACVATILGINLFEDEIQMEWVASGQVIQFVTVMVLLIVILALGLSGILKENTLGTLLGGLAGYVLAQGVGKAAARDVVRSSARAAAAERRQERVVDARPTSGV